MTARFRTKALTVLATCILLLTACSPSDTAATTTEPTTTSTPTSTTLSPSTTTTTTPPADVQAEIDWFVTILNGEELTTEEYEARFSEEFRQQVPYDSIQPILDQFRPDAPYSVVDRTGEGPSGDAVIESAAGDRVRVVAEVDDQRRFTILVLQPTAAPTLDDPPDSVDEAYQRLTEMGQVGAMTAEVVGGACAPINAMNTADPAPLGSVFKLYVLAAVGEAVAAGDLTWEDTVTIEDGLKSIPSGQLQNREAGSEVTVLEAAQLMISISDNTAADHLIDLLGRETVEAVMADYGNTTPELNMPFLTTREFAALKVGPASGLRDPQWIEGDEAERRAILEQISDITVGDIPVQDWTEPIDPELVEWFADPGDLCALALGLLDLAETVPEVAQILEINPGIAAPEGTWDRIWFKGGSEPGQLATWWLTESGGRTFFTFGSVVNPGEVLDTQEGLLLLAAARDLLAP